MEVAGILTQQQQIYRLGDPSVAAKIWRVISNLTGFHELDYHPVGTIVDLCRRNYSLTPDGVRAELQRQVQDGLLEQKEITVGASADLMYCIPTKVQHQAVVRGSHDWYCFSCHKGGPVIKCTRCYRVYHEACLNQDRQKPAFICPVCNMISKASSYKLKKDLNKLLAFTCQRLRHSLPVDFTTWIPTDEELTKFSMELEYSAKRNLFEKVVTRISKNQAESSTWEPWVTKALLFEAIDINTMESRADRMVYRSLEQFEVDALSVVHNLTLLYGEASFITSKAKKMYSDCIYDLNEIRLCHRCYRFSNFRESEDWFCEPCNPPHELVYAKYSSYPFWPAKVMKITGDDYNVRFFGANHSRATVKKSNTRPITTDVNELVSKRTSGWKQAYEELLKYQSRLKEGVSSSSDESFGSPDGPVSPPRRKIPRVVVPRLETVAAAQEYKDLVRQVEQVVALPEDEAVGRDNSSPVSEAQKPKCCQQVEDELNAARLKNTELMMELEQLRNDSRRRLEELVSQHRREISEVKKKLWCRVCEAEAVYHCCWNSSYCSTKCQNTDWDDGHKFRCYHRDHK